MVGKTVSRYKFLEKIGSGGMGIVYKARDSELNRQVALKFLPPHFTSDTNVQSRFRREAKAAAALNHAHIITVYEIGSNDDETFIAMEYVEGGSLKDLLQKRTLTIEEVIDLAVQIAEGLREAHQAGIIHRDIKPDNILIDSRGPFARGVWLISLVDSSQKRISDKLINPIGWSMVENFDPETGL